MSLFFDTFSHPFSQEDRLVIAVSGGIDSMVLLDLFLRNHPKENIVIAHFDHTLRGSESDGDREFIRDYAKDRSITFEVKMLDIRLVAGQEKASIESTARKYRYRFLEEVAEKYSAQYILTAHHLDDRIETALFNLIRGSKLGGIHALSEVSEKSTSGIKIIRPLIQVEKEEIREYARLNTIQYREDSSNLDRDFLRNKLRHDILPTFESVNPEYRRALSNFIDYTERLKSWIDDELGNFLGGESVFLVKNFSEKSPFFQKELIRLMYERANNGTIGLTESNIDELLRYILEANGSTKKNLGRLVLEKKKGFISFN